MKHAGFDERLDGIMVRAAIRLQERMARAFSRGKLLEYLKKVGLADELGIRLLRHVKPQEIQDRAVTLLAEKIRYARKGGFLKDFLERINMLELLGQGAQKPSRTAKVVELRMIEGDGGEGRVSPEEHAARKRRLTVVK